MHFTGAAKWNSLWKGHKREKPAVVRNSRGWDANAQTPPPPPIAPGLYVRLVVMQRSIYIRRGSLLALSQLHLIMSVSILSVFLSKTNADRRGEGTLSWDTIKPFRETYCLAKWKFSPSTSWWQQWTSICLSGVCALLLLNLMSQLCGSLSKRPQQN